jgi:EAL and modified HD-GYP domain-containing signal transduction protein
MFSYVARQAILDNKKCLYAYELLFRDGISNSFPDIAPDEATSKLLTNNHLNVGLDNITGGKVSFINFHEETLLYRFPTSLEPTSVVIEIVETVEISKELLKACKHLTDLGYTLALDDYDFDPKWDAFLPLVNIVKIDIQLCSYQQSVDNVAKLKDMKIKLLAEKVETNNEFEQYKALGFDYYQGYFFARPEVVKSRNIPSSKANLISLIAVSSAAGFDFDEINQIIERDVSLSYMLLRFINNPLNNKRFNVTSLRHALNYMGEVEIKKFVALLALAKLNDDKPADLILFCLLRAKFCELVSNACGIQSNPPTGFLLGLFSLLDAILDQDMSVLLDKVPIADSIKCALLDQESELKPFLSLIEHLEKADWDKISEIQEEIGVTRDQIHTFYRESIAWSDAMQQSLTC